MEDNDFYFRREFISLYFECLRTTEYVNKKLFISSIARFYREYLFV